MRAPDVRRVGPIVVGLESGLRRLLEPEANGHAEPSRFVGEALRWEHRGTTLEVTLERAPYNEIGTASLAELERLARYLRAGAGGARAVLFTSALERGFCAGADLRELHRGMVERRGAGASRLALLRELRRFIDRIHDVFDTFDTIPIPTVAAVHGVCFGGGFELALTADLIVADRSARFCFPELRLGLVPGFGGVPRLERDLGNALVRDLLLTGRSLRATRAHEIGLVSQVVARNRALEVARTTAAQVARFDRDTVATAKPYLKPIPRERLDREKELFTRMFASPVVEAALKRFVESDDPMPYLP